MADHSPSVLHGFGYAEGRYYRRCMACVMAFTGSKRSLRCKRCATAAADEWTVLSPAQQAVRRQENQRLIEQHYAAYKTAGG